MELFKLLGTIAIDNSNANSSIDETTDKAEESEGRMTSAFKKIGAAVVSYFAVDKIKDFGQACMDAYQVQERAELQLETIMKQRMDSTDSQIQKVKDLASAQQQLGIVGDEVQLSGAQQLATFLETDEALQSLIPAMNNLAVQQNGYNVSAESMVSIGNLMGKVMQGQVSALSRVGITFTEAQEEVLKYGTEQERAAMLAEVITSNVGNMNEALAQTDSGKIQQAKNNFGDMQEMIGGMLMPVMAKAYSVLNAISVLAMNKIIPRVQTFIGLMSDGSSRANMFRTALESMFSSDFIDSMEEWYYYLTDVVQIFASNTVEMFASKIDAVRESFSAVSGVIQPFVETLLNGLVTSFDTLAVTWNDGFVPAISLVIDIFTNLVTTIATAVTPAIQQISDKFQELQQFVSAAIQNYILPTISAFIDMIRELWVENQDKITLIGELFSTVFGAIASVVSWFVGICKNYIYPFLGWLCSTVQENLGNVKAIFQSAFDIIGGIAQFFIAMFKGDWQGMWDAIKSILQSGKDFISNIFTLILIFLSSIGEKIWSVVSNAFEKVKLSITEKLNDAKNSVVSIFDNIKESIREKLDAAKEVVSSAIEKIKSFFKFEWSLPQLKLPHISISGSFSISPPSVPSFGIEWYKDGGIMNDPTAFGINPSTGKMMVGGEAGAEAIAPIDVLQAYVSEAVSSQNKGLIDVLYKILEAIISMDENMGGNLREALEGTAFEMNNREFARLVKAVN